MPLQILGPVEEMLSAKQAGEFLGEKFATNVHFESEFGGARVAMSNKIPENTLNLLKELAVAMDSTQTDLVLFFVETGIYNVCKGYLETQRNEKTFDAADQLVKFAIEHMNKRLAAWKTREEK